MYLISILNCFCTCNAIRLFLLYRRYKYIKKLQRYWDKVQYMKRNDYFWLVYFVYMASRYMYSDLFLLCHCSGYHVHNVTIFGHPLSMGTGAVCSNFVALVGAVNAICALAIVLLVWKFWNFCPSLWILMICMSWCR